MKKIILAALAALISAASFAQNQGELTFEGTLGLSIKPSTTTTYVGGSIQTEGVQSFKFGMNIELGAGYFVANNFKIAGTVGFNLKDNSTTLFTVNPYLAYYFPIISDFYYVPQLFADFGFGNYIENKIKFGCFDLAAGLHLLSFEYRLSSHTGLGISAGSIYYNRLRLKTENTKTITNTFVFDINTANISLIYYL